MPVLQTTENAPGEYGDLFDFLVNELKLFRRKFVFLLNHVESKESMIYQQAWYDFKYKTQLIEWLLAEDYSKVLELPVNKEGQTGIYIQTRYVKSGKLVGLQLIEARPHEGGRYVGLTPGFVYTDEDGVRMLPIALALK